MFARAKRAKLSQQAMQRSRRKKRRRKIDSSGFSTIVTCVKLFFLRSCFSHISSLPRRCVRTFCEIAHKNKLPAARPGQQSKVSMFCSAGIKGKKEEEKGELIHPGCQLPCLYALLHCQHRYRSEKHCCRLNLSVVFCACKLSPFWEPL